jgi:hypothetical protein
VTRRAIPPLLLLLAFGLRIFSPLVADPDLWGHVRFGQDLLRTGAIVRPDPYSYLTAGQPWINHEWLAELFLALAYNLAGLTGLIALDLGLALLTLTLLYLRLVRRGMAPYGATLLLAGFALALRPGILNARPQVLTYLFLELLLLVIESVEARAGRGVPFSRRDPARYLPLLALPMLAAWANLHGAVLAGLGVLFVWGLAHLVEVAVRARSWRAAVAPAERPVLLTLVLAPAALLINPYGPRLLAFLLRTATVPRPEIADWAPARLGDLWSQLWLAAVAVTVLAVTVSRRPRRLALLMPLAAVAVMPALSVRHIPLFAVAAPALAAAHFADAWDRALTPITRRKPRWVDDIALPAVSLTASLVLVAPAVPRLQGIMVDPAVAGFPVRAVAALEEAGVEGNAAVEFNWGEYVLWRLGPEVKVSVDGRRETVYADEIYRENLDFMFGEGDWARLVDRPETNLALVDRERPVYGRMKGKTGWTLAYEDPVAALFVRDGSPILASITAIRPPAEPPDGAGLAFPAE